MRIAVAAVLVLAAAPAAAQIRPDDPMERLRLENRLAAEQDLIRQQSLAAEREAFVARQRARTADTLQMLEQSRPPLPLIASPAPLDARMAADAEAIARRQASELAAGNARILAIRPASED